MSHRLVNRSVLLGFDAAILVVAYLAAYLTRFEGSLPATYPTRIIATLPYVVALQLGALLVLGVPRIPWRHFGLRDAPRTIAALVGSAALLVLARWITPRFNGSYPGAGLAVVPYSILLIDGTFAFLSLSGVRLLRRFVAESGQAAATERPEEFVRTVLVGAGRTGALVAKEMTLHRELRLRPVGFVDDDPVKHGTVIHGVPVLGALADLPRLCQRHRAQQVLITVPHAAGALVRDVTRFCDDVKVPVRIVPALRELVGGRLQLNIRKVALEDLLRRDRVQLDESLLTATLEGRVVLVTGAGGSIGSELCRSVARFAPARLVLVERAENALFQIDRELRAAYPELAISTCVGDVGDEARIDELFADFKPSMVLHAAAHKHVPVMEANPGEAVKNNVVGTMVLANCADRHGAAHFVLISTDKAVNPTSIMGASKRVAEMFVQSLALRSKTKFVSVRFGNVLGSAGSVVPIFEEQIARGGPVTVTHPEMRRYFMTIPEAAQLVLQAAALGEGGEIFVLDMGEPVRVVDLARDLIMLSGLQPDRDVRIVFTGMRPGEKLFEELSLAQEDVDFTTHPKIRVSRIKPQPWDETTSNIVLLRRAVERGEVAVREAFAAVLPEYSGQPASPSVSAKESSGRVSVIEHSG